MQTMYEGPGEGTTKRLLLHSGKAKESEERIDMESRLKCEKPEEIVYTITFTATAAEWEKLRDQLMSIKHTYVYPAQAVVNSIDDLLGQARKIYWTEDEKSTG